MDERCGQKIKSGFVDYNLTCVTYISPRIALVFRGFLDRIPSFAANLIGFIAFDINSWQFHSFASVSSENPMEWRLAIRLMPVNGTEYPSVFLRSNHIRSCDFFTISKMQTPNKHNEFLPLSILIRFELRADLIFKIVPTPIVAASVPFSFCLESCDLRHCPRESYRDLFVF